MALRDCWSLRRHVTGAGICHSLSWVQVAAPPNSKGQWSPCPNFLSRGETENQHLCVQGTDGAQGPSHIWGTNSSLLTAALLSDGCEEEGLGGLTLPLLRTGHSKMTGGSPRNIKPARRSLSSAGGARDRGNAWCSALLNKDRLLHPHSPDLNTRSHSESGERHAFLTAKRKSR